jgi:hypothetical protein
VWAHFQGAQLHGAPFIFFPPLVSCLKRSRRLILRKRSLYSTNSQVSTARAGPFLLDCYFDLDFGFKEKKECAQKPPEVELSEDAQLWANFSYAGREQNEVRWCFTKTYHVRAERQGLLSFETDRRRRY